MMFLTDKLKVVFFSFLDVGFSQKFRQIVFIRVKKLSNTIIFIRSRHIKGEMASLLVDARRSKTPLLKLPILQV